MYACMHTRLHSLGLLLKCKSWSVMTTVATAGRFSGLSCTACGYHFQGISSSVALRPVNSRTCLTNTLWPGSAPTKLTFSGGFSFQTSAGPYYLSYFKGTAIVRGGVKQLS